MPATEVFIIDPDEIYRLGMIACLGALPDVASAEGVAEPGAAWASERLPRSALVILSVDFDDVGTLIGQLHHRIGCRVVASASRWQQEAVLSAVDAGAVGVLSKDALTAPALIAQVRAALHGAGVIPPDLLVSLLDRTDSRGERSGAAGRGATLTAREQRVLSLLADGHIMRDVATQLSYSERTVKSLLQGAVMKLEARGRSHAIARAVREGLI
jgi:DNA-binding NarL/FixJ family response regulator